MTVADDPSGQVVVKLLDVNTYKLLDTLQLDKRGQASYKMEVAEAQPEFVYFFRGDKRLAAAVVLPGDRINIEADTLGKYTVSGSEESALLQQVDQSFSSFIAAMTTAMKPLEGNTSPELEEEVNKELSHLYVEHYREALKFMLEHPYSITNVPVAFQKVNDSFPVFNQETDGIHMSNIADSLQTVYPDSKYVKALAKEAERRMNLMRMNTSLRNAGEMSFPDIVASDIKGEKVALSELDSKVIIVHFWTATDAAQKLFNNDVLKPLYKDFHSKGLEIYAVGVDADKSLWASTVKSQELPWINVCDGLGVSSPIVRNYNLGALPSSVVLVDGEITSEDVSSTDKLRKLLNAKLK